VGKGEDQERVFEKGYELKENVLHVLRIVVSVVLNVFYNYPVLLFSIQKSDLLS
jgi:hypothetical protein